jgi:integrase
MASVHRQKNSPYWYAAFTLPDGRRAIRSTKRKNKSAAMEIGLEWSNASRLGREQRLTDAQARRVIADIHLLATRDSLPMYTAEAFLKTWLENKLPSLAGGSAVAYEKTVAEFIAHLGHRSAVPVETISSKEVLSFKLELAKRVSAGTINQKLRILRGCWTWGTRLSLVIENPFKLVDKAVGKPGERRAFTVPELKTLLEACDVEWRGMILLGLYTGQRLGDLASLTWRQVDFEQREIKFTTQKTKKHLILPMAAPLADCLLALPSSDDPDAFVMPNKGANDTGTLSRQFGDILTNAGLVKREKGHKTRGCGRDARRIQSPITFHSLRHTATSLLKSAGVSDAVAMAIIGHDTAAISRGYTHLSTDTLRKAVDSLGDVLKVTP